MKKSDLIAGKHILETREGERYLVCGNLLLCSDGGFNLLEDYNEDLFMEESIEFDVMRVYEAKSLRGLNSIMEYDNLNLVYTRRSGLIDLERMILEEIEDKYKYIARDKDGELYVYNQEPVKTEGIWEIENYEVGFSSMGDLAIFSHLFPMIKHSGEEPTLISDLLEGCD